VIRYGQYGRKVSWKVKRYGEYWWKVSWIVKIYGKYGRKSVEKWKYREKMENK
jgi:hypothetical protein